MQRYANARDAVDDLRPDVPVYGFRPAVLKQDAQRFLKAFPGRTAYAVKTNGEQFLLDCLAEAGIEAFDVASPAEFAAARTAKRDAELLYMHPVKAQSDIRLALEDYRIRAIALDHEDEVAKVLRIVRALDIDPATITVFVRLATKGHAAYELSKKFGAAPGHAAELVQRISNIGFQTGLCFHVGSQVADIESYRDALGVAAQVRKDAGVELAALDIGGGFPAPYRDEGNRRSAIPEIETMMRRILKAVDAAGFSDVPLIAEPGRVIVARCLSVIVRVLLRKGRRIYINDGIWSSLSDSWTGKITLPARFLPDPARKRRHGKDELVPFRVCGATCDSVDILSRPFHLPDTIDTGDWIEIGHIGAYSLSLRSRFNGFYPDTFVEIETPFEEPPGERGYATIETMGDSPQDLPEFDRS
ncbi:ornithine decarboxylase [Tepidamorphus sp. 3E244]|uniref:ornithine decarboxylase n=1 Tax=Tepidamorphus sp. 3E244 TaxID=3385498 RepID=UPI0038FC60EF